MRHLIAALVASTALTFAGAAAAQTTVKLAYIDPLSGGAASTGEAGLKHFQYLADQVSNKDYKFEVTGYDNKLSPQESLVQLQKAIDAGTRIVLQGNGSSVAAAIIDFIGKHNERNPGKEVMFLNYAAVDPVLTNEKCSFWHFRFDAHSDIKMEALVSYMAKKQDIKKVYLINQDYSFGQAVRAGARTALKAKRPDIEIVGDEVTPLQKVTDFSPYVAKIKASGADSIITGNWAQDINLLLKAAGDAGLQANFYTYYGQGTGGPTAIRQANLADKISQIAEGVTNGESAAALEYEKAFRAKVGQELIYPRAVNLMNMLGRAVNEAKSGDPKQVAAKLSGMTHTPLHGGEGVMRRDDHQFFQPLYISVMGPIQPGQLDSENTGWGWKQGGVIAMKDTMVPTTCKMQRTN